VLQVLQSLSSGQTSVAEVPAPGAKAGMLLIRTQRSLISAGTERMLVEFGKANLVDKVRQQPDKVRQVVDKMRTDGILPTLEAVRAKLDQPLPLGYCNAGVVLAVGAGVTGFAVGDRVVSNGPHAEVVSVPPTLCARVPNDVPGDFAPFAVLGAIGLQGIRLAAPTLGEAFVVTGLGLIGLLTVQLLRANGCRVLGIDMNASRLELARRWGAETVDISTGVDPVAAALEFSRGRGVDGVLITAATKSNEPVGQAAKMCRKRGRIVLVGVSGLELSRADFYEKELSFQVSCSYGPGRYDADYEQKGHDYPFGFVRWTEQRNFEAVLDSMASGRLDVVPLITHRFKIGDAADAYAMLDDLGSLGVLLEYDGREEDAGERDGQRLTLRASTVSAPARIGFIGAGNYASRVLAPAFSAAGADIVAVVASGGASAATMARKLGAAIAATDANAVLDDPTINTVVIATPHSSHARYVLEALRRGKHVFVEKPLAITEAELSEIEECYSALVRSGSAPLLAVGFNRRFSPLVRALKARLGQGPKAVVIMVNAGAIPAGHWTQDPAVGGGRIIGEACHFIDLARYVAGYPLVSVDSQIMGRIDGRSNCGDSAIVSLRFADGSVASISYLAGGHGSYPKERVEVFDSGRVYVIDNFRRLQVFGASGNVRLLRQDKGQTEMVSDFVRAIEGAGPAVVPFEELMEVSRATILAAAEKPAA
jgi:predicted dehydrogenase/threonine dehydrogenase-like Zn-dependent dehydrogenase